MILRGMIVTAAAMGLGTGVHGVNLVRNSSFELDAAWNGTTVRVGSEYIQKHARTGDRLRWHQVTEGWWQELADDTGAAVVDDTANSGRRSLRVSAGDGPARSVISAYDRFASPGPWVLSATIKTSAAKARLSLVLSRGWERGDRKPVAGVDLPPDSDWTRVQAALDCPERSEILARLRVESGTVWIDDVQIEPGETPAAFNVRPEEWLRLQFTDHDNTRLPIWLPGRPGTAGVEVWNNSLVPLSGTVKVFVGPWDKPDARQLTEFEAADLRGGQPRRIEFATRDLPPDAYLATVHYDEGENRILDGHKDFHPDEWIGGVTSRSQFSSRLAGRFVVASPKQPAELFGVGNGMLSYGAAGSWFSGFRFDEYVHAGELGVICSRGGWNDDLCYLHAAGGMPIHAMGPVADATSRPELGNPAHPEYVDVYNPEGLTAFKERAEQMGKAFAANPMIASFQLHNERPYIHDGKPCPSVHADNHFRTWCRERHGDLAALNKRWGSAHEHWNQVEQLISASFVAAEKERAKQDGVAAIEWTGAFTSLPEAAWKRIRDNPGWAMDWLRWRTETSLWAWETFMSHARRHDSRTLYGNNLPWPTFNAQVFMPLIRVSDAAMVDLMYTSGWPKSLGTPHEMLEILEMAESTQRGKPVLGAEIYVQPSWPAEFAGMQNWAMAAHGMTINLVFGWKPYSDHGAVKETRAWEKEDARPMWFLIDRDGTKLPHYDHYRRTAAEIHDYHRRFDGHSVKRIATDVAFYVSHDTAEYIRLQTGDKPWGSPWVRTRNNLLYALRMEGVTVDFVDDVTLPEAAGAFRTVIVPASYVLSQDAARRLADFARSGGTVVLAGISGVVDPWLRTYANVGGPAWAELKWTAPDFDEAFADITFARTGSNAGIMTETAAEKPPAFGGVIDPGINEGRTFRGQSIGSMAGADDLLDVNGCSVGWARPWGNGRLIAYGPFPDTYVRNPHVSVNIRTWVRRIVAEADVRFTGRWVDDRPLSTTGGLGGGNPVVEVVVREKSPTEKFVFAFNQGGPGEGELQVPVAAGNWTTEDVITGTPPAGAVAQDGLWTMPLRLEPWGYRVLRLTANAQRRTEGSSHEAAGHR